jgi:GT2 family glycosyltransferase
MSATAAAPPKVSICIVSWNTRDLLDACAASIAKHTTLPHEVIVVDNASADGTVAMLRERHPHVRVIASEQNLGFVLGNNVAAREARGEHVMLLNPDTALASDVLRGLVAVLESDPKIGIVGPKLLNADGSVQPTCAARLPTPWNEFTSMLFLHRVAPGLFPDRELSSWDHMDDRDVESISGACMLLRKSLWESLGGFDEAVFMYAEDLDICRRVGASGLRLRYVAGESVFHYEGSSSSQRKESFFSLLSQMSSNAWYFRKHFGGASALAYRLAIFTGASFRLAIGLLAAPFVRAASGRSAGWFLRKNWALLRWSVAAPDPPPAPSRASS